MINYTQILKNKPAHGAKILSMNKDTYKLRREVMNVIYKVKSSGFNIPRVEIRIIECSNATAYAYTGQNVVHVDLYAFSKSVQRRNMFEQIILHELVHAIFGIGEVKGCKLMHCSKFWQNLPSEKLAWDLFKKYYNNWKKTLK